MWNRRGIQGPPVRISDDDAPEVHATQVGVRSDKDFASQRKGHVFLSLVVAVTSVEISESRRYSGVPDQTHHGPVEKLALYEW